MKKEKYSDQNIDFNPGASLFGRAAIAPLLLVLSLALILGYIALSLHSNTIARNNLAVYAEQALVSQKYMSEVLLSGKGVPANHSNSSRYLDEAHHRMLNGGQFTLLNGRVITLPGIKKESFKESSTIQEKTFNQIKSESNKYLRSLEIEGRQSHLLDELYKDSLTLQAAADQVVAAFDNHLQSDVSWWEVDAILVELAERQRMLIQQHIKEILLVAHGIPANYQSSRVQLYESILLMIRGGALTIPGSDPVQLPAPTSEDIRYTLEELKSKMDRFTATSNQYLMLANVEVEQTLQLQKITELVAQYQTIAQSNYTNYRDFINNRMQRSLYETSIAAVLASIFALLLIWQFCLTSLKRPLLAIYRALHQIGEGNFNVNISGPTRDELGQTASALNIAAKKLQARIASMDRTISGKQSKIDVISNADLLGNAMTRWLARLNKPLAQKDESNENYNNGNKQKSLPSINREDSLIFSSNKTVKSPINEDDLFEQLLKRANDLQAQQEQLISVNNQLEEQTAALNESKQKLDAAEERLAKKNNELSEAKNSTEKEALKKQHQDMAELNNRLQEHTQYLKESEKRLMAQKEELSSINASLIETSEQQSQELKALHEKLDEKHTTLTAARQNAEDAYATIATLKKEKEIIVNDLNRHHNNQLKAKDDEIKILESLVKKNQGESKDLEQSLSQLATLRQEMSVLHTEVSHNKDLIRDKDAEISSLQDDLTRRERAINLLEKDVHDAQSALESKVAELSTFKTFSDNQLDQLNSELSASKSSLSAASERVLSLENEIAHLTEKNKSLELQLTHSESALAESQKQYEQALHQNKNLELNLNQIKTDKEALQSNLHEASSEVESLKITIQEKQSSLNEILKEISDKNAESESLRDQLRLLKQQAEEYKNSIFLKDHELSDAHRKIEVQEQMLSDEQAKLKLNFDRINSLEEDISSADEAYKAKVAECNNLSSAISQATTDKDALTHEKRELLTELGDLKSTITALRNDLQNCRDNYAAQSKVLQQSEARLKATRTALRASIDELQGE